MKINYTNFFLILVSFLFLIFLYLYYAKDKTYKELSEIVKKKDKYIKLLEKKNIMLENKVYTLELSLKDSILYKIIEREKGEVEKAIEWFK
jgi:hypothetical protein